MRVGLVTEADTPEGLTHYHRLHEVVDEAIFAEEMGFDFWGSSEQHFTPTAYTTSAPESIFGFVAAKTSTIKLRHMAVVMLDFNHPVRVAERLATLDILSNGRIELTTARSNNPATIDAFHVPASETRGQWREGVELTVRALTEDPVEFTGEHYQFPSRHVTPRMHRPMFPVYMIATGDDSFQLAGESGLGVIASDAHRGWGWLERTAKVYKSAIEDPSPFAPYPVTNSLGYCVLTANCDDDPERAKRTAAHVAQGFIHVGRMMGTVLSQKDASYQYMDGKDIDVWYSHRDDFDYMMDHSPSLLVGDPSVFINAARRLEALGYDEIILRIDGFGHKQNMRCIEMIGKYVIPELHHPASVMSVSQYRSDMGIKEIPQYQI